MCVSGSATLHPSAEGGAGTCVYLGASNVSIPLVQEAIFYSFAHDLVRIIVTAVVCTRSRSPVDVWFAHEASVAVEDMRPTLTSPQANPHAAALACILSEVSNGEDGVTVGGLPNCPLAEGSDATLFRMLPAEASADEKSRPDAPFTCIGFGPLSGCGERGVENHLLRFGILIRGDSFRRLVRKINGTKQYFYGIDGPATVLDDIRFSHLPGAPLQVQRSYRPVFEKVLVGSHVAIARYEVVTCDPNNGEKGVRYNRGLAKACSLVENRMVAAGPLGTLTVNAWRSDSERFVILRASILAP